MKEAAYPTEVLLQSKDFAGCQPDFARAILTREAYTKAEAQRALDAFYRKEVTWDGGRHLERTK